MKTIDIKGKPYVMVKDRIIHFNKNHPDGCIRTEILPSSEDRYIIKATVIPHLSEPDRYFTGHAEEIIGSSMINKTSALENGESAAVGRCLAMMGIGIDDSIASAEEVLRAQSKQKQLKYKHRDSDNTLLNSYIELECFKEKKEEIKKRWSTVENQQKALIFLEQMKVKSNQYKGEA